MIYFYHWNKFLSRSTWACELKFILITDISTRGRNVTLHVSVWVEIHSGFVNPLGLVSRSTWACELKLRYGLRIDDVLRHAPRERVSWNVFLSCIMSLVTVTLHVSVWVEMSWTFVNTMLMLVTLHVSVWVEIGGKRAVPKPLLSRSTWACELKCFDPPQIRPKRRHAPRERVSWNSQRPCKQPDACAVTLHVSVWVEIKYNWCSCPRGIVTLHVSVWVEIWPAFL